MPINNITQTISTIPPAGARGVDVQTQFVIKQEDFQDHLQGTTVTELNTLKDQLNTRIGEINSTTTTMNGYASTASAGASTATTKAGEASTSASEALTSRNQASTFATNSSNSATKASQWANNNYNVEVEAGKYSAKHWSTVAQNTVASKVDKVASIDNAVVRFNGTTGEVQNSGVIIDDNNNVGIGVTPSAWGSGFKAIELSTGAVCCSVFDGTTELTQNSYYNSTGWMYKANGYASNYYLLDDKHVWRTAPLGTAGGAITWEKGMEMSNRGLIVGDGVPFKSWYTESKVFEVGHPNKAGYVVEAYGKGTPSTGTSVNIGTGFYRNTSGSFVHTNSFTKPIMFGMYDGSFGWSSAGAGTADYGVSFNNLMTLQSTGNLLIGTTTDNGVDKLQVNGTIKATEFRTEILAKVHIANAWTTLKDMTGLASGVYMIHQTSFDAANYGGFIMFSINESTSKNPLQILNTKGASANCGLRLTGRIVECIFHTAVTVHYSITKI